jgi:hypothetical protein
MSNVTTTVPPLDHTGLGNAIEAPEDVEEVLHNGGGSLHVAPPTVVPRLVEPAPSVLGTSWPPTPSTWP